MRSLVGPICMVALALFPPSITASEPEIIRARVPAGEVLKWFPVRTELRVMPAAEFDSLFTRAVKGAAGERALSPPSLIRAHHRARWIDGVLRGRTELVIEAAARGPADFVLEPWTPAILPRAAAGALGARDSGQASLWIEQAPNQSIALDWELRPTPRLAGRGCILSLPGVETTFLELELPTGWVPECRRGRRFGPRPAESAGLGRWEICAEAGQIDIRVCDPGHREFFVGSSPWLSTATRIDLRATSAPDRGLVNWTSDWSVELDPRNPIRLEAELDPGLELIDVKGPSVRGYHSLRKGGATHVEVALDGGLTRSTSVQFLGRAPIPIEGSWSIPAVRPLNAAWTGGTTTVVLGTRRVVAECIEKSGRRVRASGAAAGLVEQLVFESKLPGSVADLVFRKPEADSWCEVLGQLFLAGSPGRIECQLNWTFDERPVSELEVDLSPGWLPDRVVLRGRNEPVAWRPRALPSGGTRLLIELPATALAQKTLVLGLGATSTLGGARGPLELPRVRPVGARLVDDSWLTWVDHTVMVRPISARGLAWLDPGEVPGFSAAHSSVPGMHEALAWRWIAEEGGGRIDREPIEHQPAASIRTRARLNPMGRELSVDGRLVAKAGALSLESVPVWIDEPDTNATSYRFRDEAGREITSRPLDDSARANLGFPREGSARELLIRVAATTERTIEFRGRHGWKSAGRVPLFCAPRTFLQKGLVHVETPAGMRSWVKTKGLRRLNPIVEGRSGFENDFDLTPAGRDDRPQPREGTVHSFSYDEPGVQLDLFAEKLVPVSTAGVIREAPADDGGPSERFDPVSSPVAGQFWRCSRTQSDRSSPVRSGTDPPRWRGRRSDSIGIGLVDSIFRGDSRVEIEHNRHRLRA